MLLQFTPNLEYRVTRSAKSQKKCYIRRYKVRVRVTLIADYSFSLLHIGSFRNTKGGPPPRRLELRYNIRDEDMAGSWPDGMKIGSGSRR